VTATEMVMMVAHRIRSTTHIQTTRKRNVVKINPRYPRERAYRRNMTAPKRGRSQARSGQKGTGTPSFFRLCNIKARARKTRMTANPKGKNPGPGCLNLPMESWVELKAPITPMKRSTYPETRSHFSMFSSLPIPVLLFARRSHPKNT